MLNFNVVFRGHNFDSSSSSLLWPLSNARASIVLLCDLFASKDPMCTRLKTNGLRQKLTKKKKKKKYISSTHKYIYIAT